MNHYVSIHLDNGCLLFVGYSDILDYPANGILIGLGSSGQSLVPETIMSDQFLSVAPTAPYLLLENHVLQRVLDDEDLNRLKEYKDICSSEQRTTSSSHSCILAIDPVNWENRVMIYLYEVSELLNSILEVPFMFFVGECGHSNERYGLTSAITRFYEGELNTSTQSMYPGIIRFPEKSYRGGMKNSNPNGPGCAEFRNGFVFYGNFEHGMMNDGMYGQQGQYQIISQWHKGYREGNSIEEYNGTLFIGKLKEYKRVGLGVKLMYNGSVAVGYWSDNHLERIIVSLTHVGSIYSGEIRNNIYKGYGEMFYKNYTFYHGMWDGGQYHGIGRIDIERPDIKHYLRCVWLHGEIPPNSLSSTQSSQRPRESENLNSNSPQISENTQEVIFPI